MAIKIDLIKMYCKESGHEILNEEDGYILFKCSNIMGTDSSFNLVANLRDEGKLFEMVSAGFVPTELINKSDHMLPFMFYLLHFAWNTPYGTPELDKDGELRLLVEIPLEDNTLTYLQFKKIVDGLLHMSIKMMLEADSLLKTGQLPATEPDEKNEPSGEASLLLLMAALADPNTDVTVKQLAITKAKVLLSSPEVPEQLKLLIRAALGAGVPDAI